MLSGISVICFASCYAIAFGLELVSLKYHFGWHRLVLVLVVVAGLVAHTAYLGYRAAQSATAPLTSPAEWLLLAAWVLAVLYLAATLYVPRTATGLLMLPLVLALIGMAHWASDQPIAPERASQFWGTTHGAVLLAGTVTVCVGFLAGLMYLLQSYSLKHGRSPAAGLPLPSLESLERVNSRSLSLSALLMGLGFASGLILSGMKHTGEAGYVPWTDPIVLSLAAMLLWLVAAEVFRLVYPAARRGRKVAYLTLAAFLFLVITLAAFVFVDSAHGGQPAENRLYRRAFQRGLQSTSGCPWADGSQLPADAKKAKITSLPCTAADYRS
jgi:ABC-type uncharacterized transport system permease subunit